MKNGILCGFVAQGHVVKGIGLLFFKGQGFRDFFWKNIAISLERKTRFFNDRKNTFLMIAHSTKKYGIKAVPQYNGD